MATSKWAYPDDLVDGVLPGSPLPAPPDPIKAAAPAPKAGKVGKGQPS